MIIDVDPKNMNDQVLVTDPTTSTSDPLAPETPKENYVEPELENEEKVVIEKDGDFYKIKLPYIVLKGQVGKMITNNLNKMLSTQGDKKDLEENSSGLEFEVKDYIDDTAKEYSSESFFYGTDMKELNKNNLNNFLGEIMTAKEHFKNIICYIEPNDELNKNIDLVYECLKENNIEIFFNEDKALEKLKETLIDQSKSTV